MSQSIFCYNCDTELLVCDLCACCNNTFCSMCVRTISGDAQYSGQLCDNCNRKLKTTKCNSCLNEICYICAAQQKFQGREKVYCYKCDETVSFCGYCVVLKNRFQYVNREYVTEGVCKCAIVQDGLKIEYDEKQPENETEQITKSEC